MCGRLVMHLWACWQSGGWIMHKDRLHKDAPRMPKVCSIHKKSRIISVNARSRAHQLHWSNPMRRMTAHGAGEDGLRFIIAFLFLWHCRPVHMPVQAYHVFGLTRFPERHSAISQDHHQRASLNFIRHTEFFHERTGQ